MPRFTRGVIVLTAFLLIVAIYRAVKGEWSSLVLFGLSTVIMLAVILIMVLIYYIKYRLLISKINRPNSRKTQSK